MKVTIIHNHIPSDAPPDERDVLSQVELAERNLLRSDHQVSIRDIGRNLLQDIEKLRKDEPGVVFNLVESVFGKNELLYMVPAMLEAFNVPYTGSPAEAMFLTTNKVTSKKMMKQAGIPTPAWFGISEISRLDRNRKYIIKPVREDGSVDLDDAAVFSPVESLDVVEKQSREGSRFFIEEFISGREFNISMLAGASEPEVLPIAEIVFRDFPPDKERIVGYKAKWQPDTFEYGNTVREFNTLDNSPELSDKMRKIALECWVVFGLKGYNRVDFRVDRYGNPFVLEINANPCISPDSGFIAASAMAGLTQEEVIMRILNDIN